jgi:cbb3-type cytochrome oxidase subunit 3
MYEGDDMTTLDDAQPPEESGNKTFLIVAAVLGAIVLLSFLCIIGYYVFVLRPQASERAAGQATLVAQNVAVNQTLTAKAADLLLTAQATTTPTASNTPPFEQATATATVLLPDPQTVTVAAALTQAAQAQLTVTGMPTSTRLPNTGFIDDVGAPGLVVMAIALVAVILLARRLRSSPNPH